ncbi:hypothetical protein PoB_005025500 [Plakobranchus ocellatus]|uniref:Uncharacterized protein n=1 Tax=Plakobranchus ocellatus TaxID=259542 RepID=A0AAV4BWN3_9GAST|nr:hypothetical protein PoB_005025500 [Plakobranchus ocellatus]
MPRRRSWYGRRNLFGGGRNHSNRGRNRNSETDESDRTPIAARTRRNVRFFRYRREGERASQPADVGDPSSAPEPAQTLASINKRDKEGCRDVSYAELRCDTESSQSSTGHRLSRGLHGLVKSKSPHCSGLAYTH